MSTISLNPRSATPQRKQTNPAGRDADPAASEPAFQGLSGPGVNPGVGETAEEIFSRNRANYGPKNFLSNHGTAQIGESVASVEVILLQHSTSA